MKNYFVYQYKLKNILIEVKMMYDDKTINNKICILCNKKLNKINNDWSSRCLHKSCWKKDQEQKQMNILYNDYILKND